MAVTRRAIGIGAVIVILGALAVGVLAFRDRLWPRDEHGAISHNAAAATTPPAAAPAGIVPRGDVTIEPQRQQLTGVRLATVEREPMASSLRTTGVVRYDETRQSEVNVKLDGWIRELYVDYTGQFVQKGQPLFALYSPDLLAAQNEYLLALKTREQLKDSAIADARDYAARIVDAARQRLTLWDVQAEDLAAIESSRQAREAIVFRSPVSGYVLDKPVVKGMHITPGQSLYKIADLSSVWVEADVYENEIAQLRVGQRGRVTLDAYPGESFDGRAIYIYPFVQDNTRTVKIRFQFLNPRGRLKPGMYANVELEGAAGMALTVPANAVLDSGTQQIVFVSRGEGTFTPRTVKIGRRFGDRIEVLDGLNDGERVAEGATFFLDSESQLRAGLQNYEAAPSAAVSPAGASASAIDIAFHARPDPPRTGESAFEVVLKDESGRPVSDAEVSILQFMPAMPTMNMPAMRSETKLPNVGGGTYRGPAQVLMAGRWDVTVTVTRAGRQIARKQFAMTAN
jgi:membrane fusion protein, copper/silver efflux system